MMSSKRNPDLHSRRYRPNPSHQRRLRAIFHDLYWVTDRPFYVSQIASCRQTLKQCWEVPSRIVDGQGQILYCNQITTNMTLVRGNVIHTPVHFTRFNSLMLANAASAEEYNMHGSHPSQKTVAKVYNTLIKIYIIYMAPVSPLYFCVTHRQLPIPQTPTPA